MNIAASDQLHGDGKNRKPLPSQTRIVDQAKGALNPAFTLNLGASIPAKRLASLSNLVLTAATATVTFPSSAPTEATFYLRLCLLALG